ncbi:type II toxin-antitoxin system RelE/ParE family toxin [Sulfuricurvum sp.]|uniref:type II toxin-antitoxin system RelE/ParE family toxin n=1 Tax=Sulfuricurvum sp. TaxID=2025608 RepID=UPI003BB6F373
MKTKLGYEIQKTKLFEKLIDTLYKRFKNIESDIEAFGDDLDDVSKLGIHLGKNVYKVRIANSDKNKGKSSGYRLISYLKIEEGTLTYLYIYDKSDLESLSEKQLDKIVMERVL